MRKYTKTDTTKRYTHPFLCIDTLLIYHKIQHLSILHKKTPILVIFYKKFYHFSKNMRLESLNSPLNIMQLYQFKGLKKIKKFFWFSKDFKGFIFKSLPITVNTTKKVIHFSTYSSLFGQKNRGSELGNSGNNQSDFFNCFKAISQKKRSSFNIHLTKR